MSIFAGLLDPHVVVIQKPIGTTPTAPFEEERRTVAHAVEKRRREFLTGRACAHEALSALGAAPAPLLPDDDRVPIWPGGFAGSITHTDQVCAVAVARTGNGLRAVGIDLEPAQRLPGDLWETVCRTEELDWLATAPQPDRGVLARALFSAKESAFKAQFPLTRRMLEFEEIAVVLDLARGLFLASYSSGAPQAAVTGRFRISNGLLATAVTL